MYERLCFLVRNGVVLLVSLIAGLTCTSVSGQLPPGTTDASSSSQAAVQKDDGLRTQAANAIETGDMPTALKLLQQLSEQEPNDAGVLFNLGSAQDALDQSSNAAESYRHAIRVKSSYLEPHLALGLLLARTGHPVEARGELLAATTSEGGSAALRARAFRALAELDRSSNPAEARDALLGALKLTPETPEDTLLSASLAEQDGDRDAAEKAYRRLLTTTPDNAAAALALSRMLLREQKSQEAQRVLETALQPHPGEPALTAQLASSYVRQGESEKAQALLGPLHAAHPGEPSITRMYARLLSGAGDYSAAEPLFASLRGKGLADPELADDDADALIHLKRFAEAEQLLKTALRSPKAFSSTQDMAEAASHLAFAASQNNDPETVLQAVALRATVLPQSPAIVYLEAIARDQLHQLKQAQIAVSAVPFCGKWKVPRGRGRGAPPPDRPRTHAITVCTLEVRHAVRSSFSPNVLSLPPLVRLAGLHHRLRASTRSRFPRRHSS